MVLGLLSLTSIPTVTGTAFGVSEQRKANERKNDQRRMAKFFIEVAVEDPQDTEEESEMSGRWVVLRDDKVLFLIVQLPLLWRYYIAEAFYIDYPEVDETKHLKRGLGLVTTISNDPPTLGWIYADKNTHELKYGNRSRSIEHVVGPWDWAGDADEVVTLEDKAREAFVAVDEGDGEWGVYFDREGDELEGVLGRMGRLERDFMPVVLRRRMVE